MTGQMPDLTPAEQRTADRVQEALAAHQRSHSVLRACICGWLMPIGHDETLLLFHQADEVARVLAADQAQTATTLTDAERTRVGCCTACDGLGGTMSGPCWDCRGTGCAHPDPCTARHVPTADHTATLNRDESGEPHDR